MLCPTAGICFNVGGATYSSTIFGRPTGLMLTLDFGRYWYYVSTPKRSEQAPYPFEPLAMACATASTCVSLDNRSSATMPGLVDVDWTADSGRTWSAPIVLNPNRETLPPDEPSGHAAAGCDPAGMCMFVIPDDPPLVFVGRP